MDNEPFAGNRFEKITEQKTKQHWAVYIEKIAGKYKDAEKITWVMNNLGTHNPGALFEALPP